MTHWKRPTVTRKVLDSATLGKDVASIVRETGVKPNTVRAVLRRAYVSGEIHLTRFRRGRSARAVRVDEKPEVCAMDVEAFNKLMIEWSGNNGKTDR